MSNLSRVTLASIEATAKGIQKIQAKEAGGNGDDSKGWLAVALHGGPFWTGWEAGRGQNGHGSPIIFKFRR